MEWFDEFGNLLQEIPQEAVQAVAHDGDCIQDAVEFVESQALNLTRAKEGLRLAQVGYREGVNTQLETIDAQAALTTARSNYYQAIYSHVVAKLALQRAMGILTTYEPVLSQTKNEPNSVNTVQELTK